MDSAKVLFSKYDVNNNKSIDKSELQRMVLDLNLQKMQVSEALVKRFVEQEFAKIDADHPFEVAEGKLGRPVTTDEEPAALARARSSVSSVRPLASEGDHLHGPLGFVHRVLAWPVHHELQQRAHRGELLLRARARATVRIRVAARQP